MMRMTIDEAIVAATANAAHALGLAGEIGSLEAGKRARPIGEEGWRQAERLLNRS